METIEVDDLDDCLFRDRGDNDTIPASCQIENCDCCIYNIPQCCPLKKGSVTITVKLKED